MAKSGKSGGFLILIVLLVAAAAGGYYYWKQVDERPPEFTVTTVSAGEIIQNVTATGGLEAVLSTNVSSQISGIINKLYVDWNSPVKKGDILIEIDPSTYQALLAQAEGQLANAKASYSLVKLNTERSRNLFAQKLVAQADVDQAEALLQQAEAQVKIQSASVQTAQVNVARCKIFSPIDGIVISRQVDLGNTVAASLSAPTLFIIANDLTKMQINAAVSEADIGNIDHGQTVNFTVDAFPGRPFHGKVVQIRNFPQTQQNVVVYSTIIEVSNDDLKLKPGMTANVGIVIARREKTIRIPNTALRVRIPEGLKVITATPKPGEIASPQGGTPAKLLTDDERRQKLRVLMRDAGFTRGSGPPSPEVAARMQELAKERGVEIPSRMLGIGRENTGTSDAPVTRTVYKAVTTDPKHPEFEGVTVKLGITDGIFTEVLDGLKDGDVLVTSITAKSNPAGATPAGNPFGGGPGGGGRRF